MANGDTIPSATPDAKQTYYGYAGDSTPDYNSAHGIGDRDNQLSASAEHQSVALTIPERQEVFGASGHSTGLPFNYKGRTVYDDDTAPEGDARVDFYAPNHPPDELSLSSGYNRPPSTERPAQLSGGEEAEAEAEAEAELEQPKQPQTGNPDDSILSPQNMVKAIRTNYPGNYGHYTDQELWDTFTKKYPTGLDQIRAAYPEYAKVPQDTLLSALKKRYFANDSDDDFMDRMNPPQGIGGLMHSIKEQMPRTITGWYQGMSELAKSPDRGIDLLNRAVQALGIKTDNPDAKVIGPGGVPISVHPAKSEQAPKGEPHIAGELYRWAQREAARGQKTEEQHPIPSPHDLVGEIAEKAFQGAGSLPAIVPSFLPGSPAELSLVLGMTYDAVQGEGRAREKGLDNAMWFGAEGLSYRAVMQWLMYTPRGRLLSGLYWAAAGIGDEAAQDFLAGKPSTLNDLVSTAAVNGITGAIASAVYPRWSKQDAFEAAFARAKQARDAGDYTAASQLLDRSMLLLPDTGRKAVTNNLLAWRNEAIEARPGDSPAEQPGQRGFITLKSGQQEPPQLGLPTPEQQLALPAPQGSPAAKPPARDFGQIWGSEPFALVSEKAQGEETKPQAYAQNYGPDAVSDQFFYSGIDLKALGKGVKALGRAIKQNPFYQKYGRDVFAPEHATRVREESGAIIGEQIARMQERAARTAEMFWKQQDLSFYRDAFDAWRRRAFWESYPVAVRKTWFENWSTGHTSGNRVADFMWNKHLALMNSLAEIENQWRFRHDFRENYIYFSIRDSHGKLAEIESKLKRNGFSDPSFMHPRSIPDVAALHKMGLELTTYNLEDLDQIRIYQLMRAQAQAATLENLRTARRAFTTADLENPDTELALGWQKARTQLSPEAFEKRRQRMVEQIRAQSGKQVWRSPRAKEEGDKHETYWVHRDAEFMLGRSLSPLHWHPLVKGAVDVMSGIKQHTVLFNLAWSLFHPNHEALMSAIDAVAQQWDQAVEQGADAHGIMKAIGNALTLGYGRKHEATQFAPELRNFMTVKDVKFRLKDLPPWEQELHRHMMEGGFNPYSNHERQIQVGHAIVLQRIHQLPREVGKAGDTALNFGMNVIGWRPIQRWYFGEVIPALKILSFAQRAGRLFEARPNLIRPEFGVQRKIELRKIGQLVDALYGEKNLRQSFTDGYIKAIGQSVMLSYGWFNSFLDTYGGGIHDLSSIDEHWKFLQDRAKVEGSKPPRGRYASNRAHVFVVMQAMSAMYNAALAMFIGTGVKSLLDLVWPNTGPEDPKTGKTPRVKPAYWLTTEIGGLWKDIEQNGGNPLVGTTEFFMNKAQPMLASLYQLGVNRDYFGNQIAPDVDFVWNPQKGQLENIELWSFKNIDPWWHRAEFLAKQMLPFSMQSAMQPGKGPKDAVMAGLGFPGASAFVERSGAQNEIMRLYSENHAPKGKTALTAAKQNAKEAYRTALNNNDQHGEEQAIESMRHLGATPEQIDKVTGEIQKTKDMPGPYRLWKELGTDEQIQVIHQAQGEERDWLLKNAKKETRQELLVTP